MPDREVAVLSARLATVASLVPPSCRLADVGTDDAALPRRLLDENRASFCVASDRSPSGLERAARAAGRHVRTGRLALRRAVGLDALDPADRIDVVVVAGLGARTIGSILDPERLDTLGIRRLVLQPQTETRLLREHLRRSDYGIVDERMVRDRGRDYVVIAAERGPLAAERWHLGDAEEELMEAGPRLVERADPVVRSHWERELRRQSTIVARARGASRLRASRSRDLASRILTRLGRRRERKTDESV